MNYRCLAMNLAVWYIWCSEYSFPPRPYDMFADLILASIPLSIMSILITVCFAAWVSSLIDSRSKMATRASVEVTTALATIILASSVYNSCRLTPWGEQLSAERLCGSELKYSSQVVRPQSGIRVKRGVIAHRRRDTVV